MILPERTVALIAALSFLVLFLTENEKTAKLGLKQASCTGLVLELSSSAQCLRDYKFCFGYKGLL